MSKTIKRFFFIFYLMFLTIYLSCGEQPHSNIYDPDSPNTILGSISGKVQPKDSKAKVDVKLGNTVEASTTIDSDGNYAIKNLEEDVYDLVITAEGYETVTVKGVYVKARTNTDTGTITLTKPGVPPSGPGTVFGNVTDADTKAAISGVTIKIDNKTTQTDENGNYTITGIQPGNYNLTATKDLYLPYSTSVQILAGTSTSINISLMSIGQVRGKITDTTTGAGIQNASITIGGQTSYTNSSGDYYIVNILPGTYSITVSKSGYLSDYNTLHIVGGQVTTYNTSLDRAGSVTGKVTDASTGAGISGASVSGGGSQAVTDNYGNYTLNDVIPGSQTITASKAGYAPNSVNVNVIAGTTVTANISLQSGGTGSITGKVTDASTGLGINQAYVSVYSPPGSYAGSTQTNSTGDYTINNIPAGIGELWVSKDGYNGKYFDITIPSGGTATYNVSLTPNVTVYGRVIDSSTGIGIPGVYVSITIGTSKYGILYTVAVTDTNGNYIIYTAQPGNQTISASKTGYYSGSQSVNVSSSGATMVNLTLTPSPIILGKVTDANTGTGLSNAIVTITYTSGAFYASTTTDSAGNYSLNATAGSFIVSASKEGYTNNSTIVEIPLTGTVTVNLALSSAGTP